MKKLFGLFAALAVSVSLMAANTANFVIYVESPDNVDIYDEIVLAENADYSAAYENLKDAEKMADANNPSLYGYVETRKCGVIATDNLEGTLLTLETVNEENYDISFYNVAGTTYYLIDTETGDYVEIAEGQTLHLINVAANSTLADRFMISVNSFVSVTSLTTNEDGWASFAWNEDLEAVESDLKIYKGALDLSNPAAPAIELTEVDAIPANAGVFVKGAPLTTYHFASTTAAALTGNDIVGCVAATPVDDALFANKYIYALRYANGATGLYNYEGTADIPAGKAVLPIAKGNFPVHAPARISLRFGQTTAIDNVEAGAQAEKFIENGQVLIRRGNEVYNLQGQIVK